MDPHNIYERCISRESSFYLGYAYRTGCASALALRAGKICLEEKEEDTGAVQMKPLGWIFMILSWSVILGLIVFCFHKILSKKTVR